MELSKTLFEKFKQIKSVNLISGQSRDGLVKMRMDSDSGHQAEMVNRLMVGPRPLMWQRVITTCRGERGTCVHVAKFLAVTFEYNF